MILGLNALASIAVDTNCDGVVNMIDIVKLVQALANPEMVLQ